MDLSGYLRGIAQHNLNRETEELTQEQQRMEEVMLGLRTNKGIEKDLVTKAKEDTGNEFPDIYEFSATKYGAVYLANSDQIEGILQHKVVDEHTIKIEAPFLLPCVGCDTPNYTITPRFTRYTHQVDTGKHLERVQKYCYSLATELSKQADFSHVVTKNYIKNVVSYIVFSHYCVKNFNNTI